MSSSYGNSTHRSFFHRRNANKKCEQTLRGFAFYEIRKQVHHDKLSEYGLFTVLDRYGDRSDATNRDRPTGTNKRLPTIPFNQSTTSSFNRQCTGRQKRCTRTPSRGWQSALLRVAIFVLKRFAKNPLHQRGEQFVGCHR